MRALLLLVVLLIAVVNLTGCMQAQTPHEPPIASLHSHRCGRCHVAPEPRTRTRAHLEEAFSRHGKRVHLSHDDWQAMLDYLAAPAN